jgi:hypothetical protein
MDTSSKTALLIAFAIVGAFVFGALTAGIGIPMAKAVAGALHGGPAFVHGGPHMDRAYHGLEDPRARFQGMKAFDGEHPCWQGKADSYHGKGEYWLDDDRWSGKKQEWREKTGEGWSEDEMSEWLERKGHPWIDDEELEERLDSMSEGACSGDECPMWGTF